MFLTASVLPLLLGTVIGYAGTRHFDSVAFVLALFCVICAHLAINVLNDVYDELNGTDRFNTDRISPFTGGSRTIQDNVLTLVQMRRWGFILLAICVVPGVILVVFKGPLVLLFGVLGIVTGFTYSAPPLKLASRGLGELAVAFGFGVITVTGAAWLQQGVITAPAIWLGIATGFWVTNILLINEVPDANADARAGKHTLVVRFGFTPAAYFYTLNTILAALFVYLSVRASILPVWSLILPVTSVLIGIYCSYVIQQWPSRRDLMHIGIKLTLSIHAINCLWLITLSLL